MTVTRNKQPAEQELAEPMPEAEQTGSQTGDEPIDAAVVDDELLEMGKALSAAEAELSLHRDAMLRMQAEMENLRKRLIRDLEKSRKFALEGVMKDLLQVRDSLERGIETIDSNTPVETLRAGKELTLKMLNKVMSDHGLEVIDPKGEAFNPELHQAVSMQASPEHADNTVLEVLQKGFRLHDRLIRPAMVVVSSKA